MKTKFEYGATHDIHPTLGLEMWGGKIEIIGVLKSRALPEWVNVEQWEADDPDFDFDLISKPWYQIEYIDDSANQHDEIILPEFALAEVIHSANIEKIKKCKRKNEIINSIILG